MTAMLKVHLQRALTYKEQILLDLFTRCKRHPVYQDGIVACVAIYEH